jgi:hypothetical protein
MGYLLTSLNQLPVDGSVDYYLFLLRASFDTPILETVERNFAKIAKEVGASGVYAVPAADHDKWLDQVGASYLGATWQDYEDLLPALLLTDSHPEEVTSESLRLFMPLGDVDKRFGSLDKLLVQVTRFMRKEDNKFLEKFRKKEDVFDASKKIFKWDVGVLGLKIDVMELISQLKAAKVETKTPRAFH